MRWIDVTMPIGPRMPRFPGDPEVRIAPARSSRTGDPFVVSTLRMGSHAGTHVDAPRHFLPRGSTVDRLDLGRMNGPCTVVGASPADGVISPQDIGPMPRGVSRVLFRTSNSARWEAGEGYFPDFVGLSAEAARYLVARRVGLVGIDSLSVERPADGGFPVHRRLLGEGVVVLEGLLLDGVRPGRYDLHCLPLRVVDCDGAPARAALSSD